MKKLGKSLVLVVLMTLGACGGDGGMADAPACEVVPVATVEGCTSQPLPLNAFVYPVDSSALTLYVEGKPLPASAWSLTNQGHTVTLAASTCEPGRSARLVSASLGCAVEHADCAAAYGCR